MIVELTPNSDDFDVLNLPNGLLIREDGNQQFTFVPGLNWDDGSQKFREIPKRRPVPYQQKK